MRVVIYRPNRIIANGIEAHANVDRVSVSQDGWTIYKGQRTLMVATVGEFELEVESDRATEEG